MVAFSKLLFHRIFRMFPLFVCIASGISGHAQNGLKLRSVENMLFQNREDLLIHRKVVYGFNIGINVTYGERNNSQFRMCFSGGIARAIDINKTVDLIEEDAYVVPPLMLSYMPEFLIYRGGLGSSLMVGERERVNVEFRNSFSAIAGYSQTRNGVFRNKNWGRPLSKLEANSLAALYDPYGVSITLGTTFINSIAGTTRVRQQVGNGNIGIGPVQLDYSNDGPIFEKRLAQGDAYDRWWTGGGHVGVYLPSDHAFVTEIVLRYDKFTGFQQNAYEVARQLRLDYIPYIDKREAFKNQGGYNLTVGFENNFNLGVNIFEVGRFDMQNLIHTPLGMPFHQPQLQSRSSLCYGYRVFNTNPIN